MTTVVVPRKIKKNSCCPRCKATESRPLQSEENEDLHWMAAYKNTTNFCIKVGDTDEVTFVGSKTVKYPSVNKRMFDYYCSGCFIALTNILGYDSIDCISETEKESFQVVDYDRRKAS